MTNVVHLPTATQYETVIVPRENYYGRPSSSLRWRQGHHLHSRDHGRRHTRGHLQPREVEDAQVAIGLSLRPDYAAKVNALSFQPEDELEAKQWKKKLDKLCEDSMTVAESDAPANIGDALHAWTERLDRGERLTKVPREYLPHLRAYEAATAPLTAAHVERFTVHDESQTGGTPDRISALEGYGKLIIVDTKSGKNLEFGAGKICMQLAIYAHSILYKPLVETKAGVYYDASQYERLPIGNVDLERGLVVALNAKTGKCELVWVDLTRGWRAVERALWVREWRKVKDLFSPFRRDLVEEVHLRIADLIADALSREELKAIHDNAGKAWTPQHAELANQRWASLPSLNQLATEVTT